VIFALDLVHKDYFGSWGCFGFVEDTIVFYELLVISKIFCNNLPIASFITFVV